ncbi:MAG: glycine cleavage system aminomethyltransferase GcvT [Candidatus Hydrogenedentes bacterium]|nr:glycine cleavage system aminomethyltransferase GcvT [Candidatus Hydrogenedentota bacterium]
MRQTPLYDECRALGAKFVDFHGWTLPVQFTGILQEHEHTRAKVSLFDCSHMGEFMVRGEDALRAVDRLLFCDTRGLPVGKCRYGAILNESGGIIDDALAMRLSDEELYIVTNAGPLELVSRVLQEACPTRTDSSDKSDRSDTSDVSDLSDATAKIDVQGPLAREVLMKLGFAAIARLKYYHVCRTKWSGAEITISRAGYTGELGYELFIPNDIAPSLWRALLAVDGVRPAGLGARDTLRLEVGYPLSGQDFDESRTPLEANLGRFVGWDKSFVGKEPLVAQRAAGGYPLLTPIRTPDRRAPRHGFEVRSGDEVVGAVTSGTFGPSVGHGIGLAYLRADAAALGTQLLAGPKALPVETVAAPFYTKGTCRI